MSDAGGISVLASCKKESPYLLKVSYRYEAGFRALNTGKTKIHVGNIVLTEGLELSEVVVTAPIKEVELVGDTTVINADAYRIPEGSNFKELVKRYRAWNMTGKTKPWFIMGFPLRKSMLTGSVLCRKPCAGFGKSARRFGKQDKSVYDKRSEMEKFMGIKQGRKTMCSTCKPRRSSTVH